MAPYHRERGSSCLEHLFEQEPRYRQFLDIFGRMRPAEETSLLETYLLFLQVSGEGFNDRHGFFERFGLSEGRLFVLVLLKTVGSLTPSELAEAARVTPGTITGLLSGLELTGLIRREEHPTDGRKATITLTPAALPLVDQVLVERFEHINVLLSQFSLQEQQQFRSLLLKLHQRLTDGPPS